MAGGRLGSVNGPRGRIVVKAREGYVRKVVWLAGVLALSACNTPFNNALPPGSLAGLWSGSLSSADTTLGSLRLSLVPASAYMAPTQGSVGGWTMTGSWSMTLASAADSGTVAGDGVDGSFGHATRPETAVNGPRGRIVVNGKEEEDVRKVVWFAGMLALSACNTPFNNALPPGSLAGRWSGSLSSADTALGSLRLSLVPASAYQPPTQGSVGGWTMTGNWSMTLASAADSGTVAADGKDGSVAMHFNLRGASGCDLDLNATRMGSSLIGLYTASACAVPDSGNFVITKE